MNYYIALSLLVLGTLSSCLQTETTAAYGPLPTEDQLALQDMEMYAFLHYSLNTYTDQEWGYGDEDPKLFNPSDLDTRQWVKTCKSAGMKGITHAARAVESV